MKAMDWSLDHALPLLIAAGIICQAESNNHTCSGEEKLQQGGSYMYECIYIYIYAYNKKNTSNERHSRSSH